MRFALKLEYDGTGFVGWQRQDNGVSIQEVLERAAAALNGGSIPSAVVAGRTDAGVHAEAQVASIDLPDHLAPHTVADALNFHLKPHRVVVLEAAHVTDPDWHPRFSATERRYRYVILNRRARPAHDSGFVWHVKQSLDAEAMHTAAQILVGRHDFSSFRAAACQANSPIRTLGTLTVHRSEQKLVIEVVARSFLHHQVRNMVGTLKLIGEGTWPITKMTDILAARDRTAAGPTAPAEGLTLTAVAYRVDPFRNC